MGVPGGWAFSYERITLVLENVCELDWVFKLHRLLLSSGCGTYNTVAARYWRWLEPFFNQRQPPYSRIFGVAVREKRAWERSILYGRSWLSESGCVNRGPRP